jgi:flagellar biosynthesis protein FliR
VTIDQLISTVGVQQIAAFFLVLARVSPLFLLAPLFSSKAVTGRVRSVIAVALAIGMSPMVARQGHIDTDGFSLAMLIGKEILIGAAYAYALNALSAALTIAGGFLDTSIGFSFGATVDPINGVQSTLISQLYGMVGVMVFIAIDGDSWVIRGIGRTYDLVGATQYPSIQGLVAGAVQTFSGIFISAVEVAGPVMLALIVTDAAFGVVSRVVPQLNVFQVGFPAKVVVGFLLIIATLPFVANWISGQLQVDVSTALQAIHVA